MWLVLFTITFQRAITAANADDRQRPAMWMWVAAPAIACLAYNSIVGEANSNGALTFDNISKSFMFMALSLFFCLGTCVALLCDCLPCIQQHCGWSQLQRASYLRQRFQELHVHGAVAVLLSGYVCCCVICGSYLWQCLQELHVHGAVAVLLSGYVYCCVGGSYLGQCFQELHVHGVVAVVLSGYVCWCFVCVYHMPLRVSGIMCRCFMCIHQMPLGCQALCVAVLCVSTKCLWGVRHCPPMAVDAVLSCDNTCVSHGVCAEIICCQSRISLFQCSARSEAYSLHLTANHFLDEVQTVAQLAETCNNREQVCIYYTICYIICYII